MTCRNGRRADEAETDGDHRTNRFEGVVDTAHYDHASRMQSERGRRARIAALSLAILVAAGGALFFT